MRKIRRKKGARQYLCNKVRFETMVSYLWAAIIGTILALLLHNTAAGTILTLICLFGAICGIIYTGVKMHK